jgi:hypothetical protein
MTSVADTAGLERTDIRTIVGGGIRLGILTAVGVTAFALLSRTLAGPAETAVQSLLVLAGAVLSSFLPALWVRPRSTDAVAWAALVGLLGALVFTVLDVALLRPLAVYHWTWDRIGGGSGFWYIPVWWILAAVLAWLGSWIEVVAAGPAANALRKTIPITVGIALAVAALLVVATPAPFHATVVALAYGVALAVHLPLAAVTARR